MEDSQFDAVAQTERALLGTILLFNDRWSQTAGLSTEDFSLDSHRRIFGQMAAMFEDQRPVDVLTLVNDLTKQNELERCGGVAYISDLDRLALPENFEAYVRDVRTAAIDRKIARAVQRLSVSSSQASPEKLSILRQQTQQLQDLLISQELGRDSWRSLFHSYEDVINAPQARFAIEGFLQEDGITLIGALPGHGKTLTMLAIVRALLEGGKLFHHFAVNKTAERVIYLIPEAGLSPFATRVKTFHLEQYVQDGRFFFRTLSAQGQLLLSDSRLLEAVKGADVFLDTAIRFMVGDENSAAEQKQFADTLFALQRAGARTITGAHHSPKSFGKDTFMTLENVLRGSGDIGAMLPALPFLAPLLAANPGTAALAVGGGLLGQTAGQKGAELLGANPDQAALAGDIGGIAAGYGGAKIPGFLSRFNPTALKAGASTAFDAASQAAGSNPVDIEAAGQAALKGQELQQVGRTMPRTMQRFLSRVTAPNAEPLSYDEARQFYSAASELSANEQAGITPAMRRALNQYKGALGDAIQQTADNAGVGTQYAQGMSDYAKAKRMEDAWEFVRGPLLKKIVPALTGTGALVYEGHQIAKGLAK